MSSHPIITGYVAQSGRRYVRVQADSGSATLAYEAFSIANTKLAADLTAGGLPLFAKDDLETIFEEVRALTFFEPGRVVEHSGWDGKSFGHLDGNVNCKNGPPPEVLYRVTPERVQARGSLDDWKQNVIQPLADHPLPAFVVMAMFLPPLLRFMPQVGNVTIELVGAGRIGKSITQMIAASVVGPPSYIHGLRDIQRDLEGVQRLSRDYPLIVDHVAPALAILTKPKKAGIFTIVDHDIPRAPGGRFTLLSGRQPLREACGMPTSEDSIITIDLSASLHGVFSSVPEGHATCAAFSDSLAAAVQANHGTAFPAFLAAMRENLRNDHKAFKAKVESLQARFLASDAVRENSQIEHRVARFLAGVYAAAALARDYHVLPKKFPRKAITLAMLDIYARANTVQQPFLDRLEALIASGNLVTITKDADRAAQANAVNSALGTLEIKADKRIVRISPEKIEQAFHDWRRIRTMGEVREPNGPLKLDGKNLTTKGRLAPDMDLIRLHQFVLPPAEVESMFGVIEAQPNPVDDGG